MNGAYAAYSRRAVGRMATPMGRYQIVGSTLRDIQEEMGLPDDTVFNQETQDKMFEHLVQRRLKKATLPNGNISMARAVRELRNEWAGFKHVPRPALEMAIRGYVEGMRE